MTDDSSTARVRVHALGGFRIVVDGRELRLRTRKEAMVLLRLAHAGERGLSRDELLGMLWPESSETRARHSLSEALRGIEQATPIEIVRTQEQLALPPGSVALDVDELEVAMRSGDVATCARLYIGGFLAGWYPPTPESSHWVDGQGARIARALEKAMRAELASRRQATDSHGVVAVVALLEKLGVATDADREAAAEAEQITRWESLRPGEGIQSPLPLDREGPFVGRTKEMKLLTAELDRALAGELRVVLVSGEAGIGKTRTCQRLARLAALRGCRLFLSTCYELEQSVAFGAIGEAFAGAITSSDVSSIKPLWQKVLADVFPAVAAIQAPQRSPLADSRSRENWTLEATRALIETLCATRTGVIVVDDLQWADAATCRLLHHVARRAEPASGLLILVAYRDIEADSSAALFTRDATAVRVHLGPLTFAQTRAQIVGLQGTLGDQRAERIARRSRGNPFFARELALADGQNDDPVSLRDAVLARTARLPPQAQSLLSFLCVAGGRCHLEVLAAAMDAKPSELLGAISTLRGQGFIDERGATLYLDHDVVRTSIYTSLGEPMRRSLHLCLARTPSRHLGSAARAHHFDLGEDAAQASREAMAAADEAALRHATDERLDLLEMALRLSPASVRPAIADAFATACLEAGHYRRMMQTLEGREGLSDLARLQLDVAKLKRSNLKDFKNIEAAAASADDVLSRAGGSPREFLEAAREKLRYGHEAGRGDTVIATVDELSSFAARNPGSPFSGRALCLAAYQRAFYAPGPEVEASLTRALRLAETLSDAQLQVQSRLGLAVWAVIRGETTECLAQTGIALAIARKTGLVVEELRARSLMMAADFDRTNFRRVIRHGVVLKGRSNDVDHWNSAMLARLNTAAAWIELGDSERAAAEARQALTLEADHPDWLVRVNAAALGGIAALEMGDAGAAVAFEAQVRPLCSEIERWMDDPSHVMTFLIRMMLRQQRVDDALELTSRVAVGCRGRNTPGYWSAAILHSLIARRAGRRAETDELVAIRDEARSKGNVLIADRAAEALLG